MDQRKLKKASSVAVNVILYAFLALCIIFVTLTVFSKRKEDGAAEIFGRQLRLVISDSMEACEETDVSDFEIKSIPLRSLIFIETVPDDAKEADAWYASLEEGDVLTFRYVYAKQVTITHRIDKITEKKSGGYIIELVGDNKNASMNQLYQTIDTSLPDSPNYVIGRVTGTSYFLGVILSILSSTTGLIFVVIVPCAIIILLEVLKIVGVVSADKKKAALAESQKKDEELALLRERLAALEEQKTDSENTEPPSESI